MANFSHISNAHPTYIESLYTQYLANPSNVDDSWALFFRGFEYGGATNGNGTAAAGLSAIPQKELSVMMLIDGYRHRGHLLSTTNPLKPRRDRMPHLDLSDYGLGDADLATVFVAGEILGLKNATLANIQSYLQKVYCGSIGFEYSHIENNDKRFWLRERIEKRALTEGYGFSIDKKRRILEKLNEAVGFEEFLGKKFVGKKRFSLEGGEATIAALDAIINASADTNVSEQHKVEEVVIGMAHRGRLNVLANIMRKTYENIFNEFDENVPELAHGSGDVKYHLGYSSQVETTSGKNVYLKLLPNPSHLEAIDPVIVGYARAKADSLYGSDYDKILPIMIHGDAALAGLGIVYETVQMSQLPGYFVGGTIHFVINNQIGFTTSYDDARSSTYSSSVANVVQAPTFHVNGDDPEAVVWVCELAAAYRQEFNTDVFVDMVCYRKHGHNESDNPEFTQPQLWKIIKGKTNPREMYIETLSKRSDLAREMAEQMKVKYDQDLQDRLADLRQNNLPYKYQESEQAWRSLQKDMTDADFENSPETGISKETIDKVVGHLMTIPKDFRPLKDIDRYLKGKQKLIDEGTLDWGYGELLAYGSLLLSGRDVRISGEDVKRGTFSHRHACFFDAETNGEYNRLNNIAPNEQGKFHIYNSLLSEYAVMGFEYGYGLAHPDPLVIWEAQFGDFNNGAQTIIDQFLVSGESKWQRQNGLVLLLPHGFEGQGPEHSSARLERFMQLCAENNITVANVTTPAQIFHILRRQLARPFRKPLIVMSPKSLLRHPECVSPIADFELGKKFEEVLDDTSITDAKNVKKVLFCSGKVYYDLIKGKREKAVGEEVAIVRVEQLYPFPEAKVAAIQAKYSNASAHWVQEEPQNNGTWFHIATFHSELGLRYIGRTASASPATGISKRHEKEQKAIVEKSLTV